MSSSERSSIINAIWLCKNCHKTVDDDELRYPAGLLFEWQKDHDRKVTEQLGKTGAHLRQRYEDRRMREFGELTYLAERLIAEKPDHWEYRLTTEVLRSEMSLVLRRWDTLRRGLYMKSNTIISKDESIPWMTARLAEAEQIATGLTEILNVEFARAWGDVGTAGDDAEIVNVCRLFCGMCSSAIDWEENVRFALFQEPFRELQTLLSGTAGGLVDEAAKIPKYLTNLFSGEPEPGLHKIEIVFSMPDGWSENVEAALETAAAAFFD